MTAWFFILLSSGCSVLVAHLLKLIEFRKLNTLRVLTVNYLVASGVAFLTSPRPFNQFSDETGMALPVIILSGLVGIFFITTYFIYSKSVFHNGVGISVAAMRISLLIPVLLSTIWYQEYLSTRQWAGIILIFFTLYLLIPDKKKLLNYPLQAGWLLLLLFILTGIGDASLKIYEEDYAHFLSKQQFMGYIYTASFLTGSIVVLARRRGFFTPQEIFLGIVIGIPNLYSAIFLIEALSLISGGIVYTVANILTVVGATILGIWRWRDTLSRTQWGGLLLAVAAILLLIG